MRFLVFVALYLSTSLVGCGDNGDRDDSTNLRVINTATDLGPVDLTVDYDVYREDIEYLENTGYMDFDTNQHIFQISPSNSLSPIDIILTSLADDVDYSYIVYGSSVDADAMLLKDDNEPAGEDAFKVRIINVAQSARSYNVYIGVDRSQIAKENPIARNLRYKAVTSYLGGPGGIYDIIVTDSKTNAIVSILPSQKLAGEDVYTLLLIKESDRLDAIRVIVLNDRNS
jgi:hypothetical protein